MNRIKILLTLLFITGVAEITNAQSNCYEKYPTAVIPDDNPCNFNAPAYGKGNIRKLMECLCNEQKEMETLRANLPQARAEFNSKKNEIYQFEKESSNLFNQANSIHSKLIRESDIQNFDSQKQKALQLYEKAKQYAYKVRDAHFLTSNKLLETEVNTFFNSLPKKGERRLQNIQKEIDDLKTIKPKVSSKITIGGNSTGGGNGISTDNTENYSSSNSTQNVSSTKGFKSAEQIYAEHQKNMNIQYTGQNLLSQGNYLAAAQHYASNGYKTEAYASVGVHVASEIIGAFKQAEQAKIERNSRSLQSSLQTLNEYNKEILKALENEDFKEFISIDNKIIGIERNILEYASFLNRKTSNDYSGLKKQIKENYKKRVRQSINYLTYYFIEELDQNTDKNAIEVYNSYISKLDAKKLDYNYTYLIESEKKAYWEMLFGNNNDGKPILNDFNKPKFYYITNFNDEKIKNVINSILLPDNDKYSIFTWVLGTENNDKKTLEFLIDYDLNLYYNIQNIWNNIEKPKALHKYIASSHYNFLNTLKYTRQQIRKIKRETGFNEKELFDLRKDCLDSNCSVFDSSSQLKKISECLQKEKTDCIPLIQEVISSNHNGLSNEQLSNLNYYLGVIFYELNQENDAIKYYEKSISKNPNNRNSYYNLGVIFYDKAKEISEKFDKTSAKELKSKRNSYLSNSLSNFEKSYKLKNDNNLKEVIDEIRLDLGKIDFKTIQTNKAKKQITQKEISENKNTFYIIEENAAFPGGKEGLINFLSNNIKTLEVSGKVIVSFIIDKDGSITDINIEKSEHELLSKEAIRLLNLMPKWKPAKQRGKVVSAKLTLPLNF